MSGKVFLHYTQEELNHVYDQRAWAPNAGELMTRWAGLVAGARAANPGYREVAYGPKPAEKLDLYPAAASGAPIHVHIHGGAWRIQSKEDVAFAAAAMNAAGMHLAVPGFDKLPTVRMPEMVDELARAVAWVHAHAPEFGGDRSRFLLSGHSSGAHLAATLATLDWRRYGLPASPFCGLVCMSGGYDLEGVMLSNRREYIDLTPEEADALSPPRHAGRIPCPVALLHGERETPEFIRQSRAFAGALEAADRLHSLTELPGHNHFEVADALADPDGRVLATLLDMLQRAAPPGS